MALFVAAASLPWLVEGCGPLALVALVPLLLMERSAGRERIWPWYYAAFALWNAATTFWVCNATFAGGIAAILLNALQMAGVFGVFRLSRRYLHGSLPYILLAVLWIAWERYYFSAEVSWPWLVLGGAFAGTLPLAQFYEYTGILGGSLWIWAVNLGVFGLITAVREGLWKRWNLHARAVSALSLLAVVIVPAAVSLHIYKTEGQRRNCDVGGPMLDVIAVQPNIDPYHKFEAMTQEEQTGMFLGMLRPVLEERCHRSSTDTISSAPLLVLAPETFPTDIVTNNIQASPTFRAFSGFLKDYPGVNLLFGASSYDYIRSVRRPSYTVREVRDNSGLWVQAHNSGVMTDASGRAEIYHKSKLVIGTEMTPYPAVFTRLDDLLGGVMARDAGQDEVSVVNVKGPCGENIPIGCVICYESVYGEYCTGYVRKGAEALAVITNDAWWGDTPGYWQHLRFSSLRAIETRRDIVRCANTGISAIIDRRGVVRQASGWWKQEVLSGRIALSGRQTFYVENGDITGRLCHFLALLLCAWLAVTIILEKKGGRLR